jgi:RimJ/RimL family protein N-acetyltransferase
MTASPPEHIGVPRPAGSPERLQLALARTAAEHVTPLAAAVTRNLDHLAPFMAWAVPEGATEAAQASRLTEVDQQWAAGEQYAYLLLDQPSGRVLGCFGLHRRSAPGTLEIGYWLDRDATGQGYATAAAGALTAAAFALPGITQTEIHCDPANQRSARVAERLGYRLDRIDDVPSTAPAHTGRSMIWVRP